MFRRREPAFDWESANGIMAMLMRIDANVEEILGIVRDDDGEETTDTAPDS
jgi:hypothetical protein